MLPLTGTTDINHMREDLDSSSFDLAAEEVSLIETLGAR
jgi:diketogulonate reductase-like aldo/keto reductase